MKTIVVFLLLLFRNHFVLAQEFFDHNEIGDFLRNKNGTIKTNIDPYSASEFCKKIGSRLPTAKELATYVVKYGGAEILDLDRISPSTSLDGFYLINTTNEDGGVDVFYYSNRHYTPPSDDSFKYWVWSSSLSSGVFLGLNGSNGFIRRGIDYLSTYIEQHSAVRCIKKVQH